MEKKMKRKKELNGSNTPLIYGRIWAQNSEMRMFFFTSSQVF